MKNCKKKKKILNDEQWTITIQLLVSLASYSHTCYRWACHPRGDWFPGRLPGYWIQEAWKPIGRSGCRCQENSFLLHTGYTPELTSPGTPQPCTRKLRGKAKGTRSNEKKTNITYHKHLYILLQKSCLEYKIKWQTNGHADHSSTEYNAAPVIKELNLCILLHTVSVFALFHWASVLTHCRLFLIPHLHKSYCDVFPCFKAAHVKKMWVCNLCSTAYKWISVR